MNRSPALLRQVENHVLFLVRAPMEVQITVLDFELSDLRSGHIKAFIDLVSGLDNAKANPLPGHIQPAVR